MVDEKDIERLSEIFVTRKECDNKSSEIDKKVTEADKNIALLKQDIDTIKFLAKTTLVSTIGVLVTQILLKAFGG